MARARLLAVGVLVVLLVGLTGCAMPSATEFDTDREAGHIGNYAHDDVYEFDGSEGLTQTQLEAVKYRSMARIEVVRGLKFEHDVELEVMERAEYREQRSGSDPASATENELWRGAFIVDGETDVNQALDDLYGESVQGYYVDDRIVVIADDTDEIRLSRRTLVHELVHALQDQQFGLGRSGDTLDARRAETGLIEGEARYVPHLYDERCGETWQCLPDLTSAPANASAESDSDVDEQPFNAGLFLSIYTPYSEGPAFVDALYERGGWSAVDRAYDRRPTSTSQLIHPDRYPDDDPVAVDVPDRSSDDWEPATSDDEPRTETVGEATMFASLWVNGVVDRPLTQGGTELSPYNYSSPATAGWGGDTVRVYHDADEHDRTGHVWRSTWESEADAAEFAEGYRTLLQNRGGEAVDAGTGGGVEGEGDVYRYRIPDDESFAGAYRISVAGETVTVVGAPTVEALEAIHATESSTASRSASVDHATAPGPTAAGHGPSADTHTPTADARISPAHDHSTGANAAIFATADG